MKAGDFVRFKNIDGEPCGQYAVVIRSLRNSAIISYVDTNNAVEVVKSSLHLCTEVQLRIPEEKLVKCLAGKDSIVSHVPTSLWKRALNKRAEIVTLYAPESKKVLSKFSFVCENIKMTTRLRESVVEITLGRLIL